jgi:hypothetical protein
MLRGGNASGASVGPRTPVEKRVVGNPYRTTRYDPVISMRRPRRSLLRRVVSWYQRGRRDCVTLRVGDGVQSGQPSQARRYQRKDVSIHRGVSAPQREARLRDRSARLISGSSSHIAFVIQVQTPRDLVRIAATCVAHRGARFMRRQSDSHPCPRRQRENHPDGAGVPGASPE